MSFYGGITVDCGTENMFEVQEKVEKLMPKTFYPDGGGAMVGGNERDIFFSAPSEKEFRDFQQELKQKGFKVLD